MASCGSEDAKSGVLIPEIWIPIAASAAGSALIGWGGYKLFIGRFMEWRAFMDEKHTDLVRRLERHIDKDEAAHEKEAIKVAVIERDVAHSVKHIQDLRDYKHLKIDPYIGALDALNKRVERIEKYLNGNLK